MRETPHGGNSDFKNIYFAGFSPLNIAVTENGMGCRCLDKILASVGWVTSSSKGLSVCSGSW